MSTDAPSGGPLTRLYSNRIGRPQTNDEARGYWVFALGVLLGIVGIGLLIVNDLQGPVPQWPVVIAGAALVLLIAGPLVRLPLRRLATILVYVGAVLSLAALPWFVVSYPGWRPQASGIVGLYSLGLAVMAIGGVFVPVLTAGAEREEELARRGEQIEELERVLEDADADGDDLSRLIDELRQSEHDLSATLDRLRAEQADTAADEADLAARLAALRQSQARFELYEDAQEQFRWRLRHRNGNILADSGQGYADRRGSWDGIESVKRNAPNADVAGA